jgi:hypothetical protein
VQIRIILDPEVGKILIIDPEVLVVIDTINSRLANVETLHRLHKITIADPLKDNNLETQEITFHDGNIIAIAKTKLEIRIHLMLGIQKNEAHSFKTRETQVLDHELTPGTTINAINVLKGI